MAGVERRLGDRGRSAEGRSATVDGLNRRGPHHFAPAHIEHGKSLGGAFVSDFGGDRICDAVAADLRGVPGRRVYRLQPVRFIRQVTDPAFGGGISRSAQAIPARDSAAHKALSNGPAALPVRPHRRFRLASSACVRRSSQPPQVTRRAGRSSRRGGSGLQWFRQRVRHAARRSPRLAKRPCARTC